MKPRLLVLFALFMAGCAGGPVPGPAPGAVLFTGAGDIAVCGDDADEATAALLDRIPGVIWTTGDNAYPDGSWGDFQACYEPSWGRHRYRTRPTPGNHEYWTAGAEAYFRYFGEAAGEAGKGWYSYRYGEWLVVALNSNIATERWSEQSRWLRKLLRERSRECTLAYFHHPLVSSGAHGSQEDLEGEAGVHAFWDALYAAGAEVVLAGHDHHYERFGPMTPYGSSNPRGIRQFIVGTGGGELRREPETLHPLSERFIGDRHGVLKLTLEPGGYRWSFIDVEGRVLDSGRDRCR